MEIGVKPGKKICKWCKKEFKREGNFVKHVSMCEIIHTENDAVPLSNRELFALVGTLTRKVISMEEKLDWLVTRVKQSDVRRINVIEWLNDPSKEKPDKDFIDFWNDAITTITVKELQYLYKNKHIEGINNVIRRIIREKIHVYHEEIPLKSFQNKKNKLYIYENKRWIEAPQNVLSKVFEMLNNKILEMHNNYFKDKLSGFNSGDLSDVIMDISGNNVNVPKNDDICEDYCNAMQEVMGGSSSQNTRKIKYLQCMCDEVEVNLKNVVSYEFT